MNTKNEILEMKANQQTDDFIAINVMGWKKHKNASPGEEGWYSTSTTGNLVFERYVRNWHPSKNISTAWEVVDKLIEMKFDFFIHWIWQEEWAAFFDYAGEADIDIHAPTAPLAICRAAAVTLGHEAWKF